MNILQILLTRITLFSNKKTKIKIYTLTTSEHYNSSLNYPNNVLTYAIFLIFKWYKDSDYII